MNNTSTPTSNTNSDTTVFEDTFSKEIFEQTYVYNGETVNQVHDRVARDLASVEKTPQLRTSCERDFRWALSNFKFVPGGRILSNAGIDLKGTTYINCFVSGPRGKDIDSINGILNELKNQALILKSEGGYGICANFMRPRGAYIFGIANESPGAVTNLKMWDTQAAVITAGSGKVSDRPGAKGKIRKGAQMVTMSVWHPDIERFITAKQTPGELTKFNMSVMITDAFMDAVKNNKPWKLEFPNYEKHRQEYHDHWDGNLQRWRDLGYSTTVYKEYENANELWDLIMKSTYNRNEPGVLFEDTINNRNNLYYTEHINATNPCVTGDTLVTVSLDGKEKTMRVDELVGKKFSASTWHFSSDSTDVGFWCNGEKTVYEITFVSNTGKTNSIKATIDHKFLVKQPGDWVQEWYTVDDIMKRNSKGIYLVSGDNNKELFRVSSVEHYGFEKVYDCTIPGVHFYTANGIVSHNCGEQVLPIGGVCLLGSINLTQMVNKEKTDFDYMKLERLIKIAVRMMDNVNDRTFVPLEEQRENLKNKRRIGLGIMGYGSALMLMKIRYGSTRALELTKKLMSYIANVSYYCSSQLAIEKGPFPLFDAEKYLSGKFVQTLNEDVKALIKKHGIRNSHLLSIQPTGNTAVCSNNVSGGLEPLFMTEYTRTSIFPETPEGLYLPTNVDWKEMSFDHSGKGPSWEWVKEGDENLLRTTSNHLGFRWKYDRSRGLLRETPVMDYSVRKLKESGEWDPNAGWAATAMSLKVEDHISTMNVMSKYIDSAMSKTINVPNDYPYTDFKDMYRNAYDTGTIKGVTSYRTGTMTFVLSETKSDPPKKADRPKEVDCDINIISTKKDTGSDREKWIVLVGLVDSKPYEVFTVKQNKIRISDNVKKGKLVKTKDSKYNLETEYFSIDDLQSHFESDEQVALTRIISIALRNGTDIDDIYHQLINCGGTVVSFARAIARTLAKYVTELKETTCPDCSDPEGIIFQEGCLKCKNCNYSKCL